MGRVSSLTTAVNTLQLFAEPTRVRLMALLEGEELTVAELVTITELAQSSVSTHLGKLREPEESLDVLQMISVCRDRAKDHRALVEAMNSKERGTPANSNIGKH